MDINNIDTTVYLAENKLTIFTVVRNIGLLMFNTQ